MLVGPWQTAWTPGERGARIEVRRLADEAPRGSRLAAERVVIDQPLFRADLFDRAEGPPGNLRAAHFHPWFDGVEPSDRHWSDDLHHDPAGWLAAELGDLPGMLTRAGVDHAERSWVDDEAAALRDAVPAILAAVEATWEQVRAGDAPR